MEAGMLQINLGIVDTTNSIHPTMLAETAAAINIQVTRDLPQFWPVSATVATLPNPNSIPQGVCPLYLVAQLPDGEGGVHQTDQNQPYALVAATPGTNAWTIDASHEIVEMLIDPFGNRLQVSTAIRINDAGDDVIDANGGFEYLVEACDPCEAPNFAYPINGIMVSDFLTQNFYDRAITPGTRYSFTGALTRPRQLLPGGYISWRDLDTGGYKQILWLGPNPAYRTLPPAPAGFSLREYIDSATMHYVAAASATAVGVARAATSLDTGGQLRAHRDAVGRIRAEQYKWRGREARHGE
jgi:hypothetical protein